MKNWQRIVILILINKTPLLIYLFMKELCQSAVAASTGNHCIYLWSKHEKKNNNVSISNKEKVIIKKTIIKISF